MKYCGKLGQVHGVRRTRRRVWGVTAGIEEQGVGDSGMDTRDAQVGV